MIEFINNITAYLESFVWSLPNYNEWITLITEFIDTVIDIITAPFNAMHSVFGYIFSSISYISGFIDSNTDYVRLINIVIGIVPNILVQTIVLSVVFVGVYTIFKSI